MKKIYAIIFPILIVLNIVSTVLCLCIIEFNEGFGEGAIFSFEGFANYDANVSYRIISGIMIILTIVINIAVGIIIVKGKVLSNYYCIYVMVLPVASGVVLVFLLAILFDWEGFYSYDFIYKD